ncbi:hypothetical protein [Marinobacterium marinum]|uniref:Uncharacterized protein n=1 Tax=Marinobacterium marinum TaxID=2756129 RepID=A0A7W1WXZ0_9GAMM|nr:hypothetical protein [Marinobacterium marinum]MBA4502292.1 hypothetical protein [Marinobacterium marinum]
MSVIDPDDAVDIGAESVLESRQLWMAIPVGSLVQLEADLFAGTHKILSRGRLYEVLAKTDRSPGGQMFVVQSELTRELIELHPGLICNYLDGPGIVHRV